IPNGGSGTHTRLSGTTGGCIGNYSGSCSASPRYADSAEACATTSRAPMPNDHDHRTGHRALLASAAIGAPVFVVVFLIEGVVPAIRPPGYSPLRHPVSGFAIGEFGRLQTVNFLVIGVLLLAFAVGLRAALRSYGGGIWAPVLVGLIA